MSDDRAYDFSGLGANEAHIGSDGTYINNEGREIKPESVEGCESTDLLLVGCSGTKMNNSRTTMDVKASSGQKISGTKGVDLNGLDVEANSATANIQANGTNSEANGFDLEHTYNSTIDLQGGTYRITASNGGKATYVNSK